MNIFIRIYDWFNKKIFGVDSLQERENDRRLYLLYKSKQEKIYLEFINQCEEDLIKRQDKDSVPYLKLSAIRDYVKELYFILHDDAEKLEEIRKERRLPKYKNINLNEVNMSNEKNQLNNQNNQWRSELKKIVINIRYHLIEKQNSSRHKNYRDKLEKFILKLEATLIDNKTLYHEYDNQLIELISTGLKEIEIGNRFYGANLYKINSLMKNNTINPCTVSMQEISDNTQQLITKVENLESDKSVLQNENDVFRKELDKRTNGKLTELENKYNEKLMELSLRNEEIRKQDKEEMQNQINSLMMLVNKKDVEIKNSSIIKPKQKQEIINDYLDEKVKEKESKYHTNIKLSNFALFHEKCKNKAKEVELENINELNN